MIDEAWAGSSPLTRGKQLELIAKLEFTRLIPAHAGKTHCKDSCRWCAAAHPRSRGENPSSRLCDQRIVGSSPLTRGKLHAGCRFLEKRRLIPAHAGKTPRRTARPPSRPAHPRSRGENSLTASPLVSFRGSSPLTRGKHFLTCAFTAQIDQILETLELAASFGSYLIWVACATDAPQDPVRSIGLVLPSSMGAS